ncbi:MAG: DUF3127 domain-containing protein [Rikenellaceae bacterium]
MANITITATVLEIMPVKSGISNATQSTWTSQEMVLLENVGCGTSKVIVTAFNDQTLCFAGVVPGMKVEADVWVESREWNKNGKRSFSTSLRPVAPIRIL